MYCRSVLALVVFVAAVPALNARSHRGSEADMGSSIMVLPGENVKDQPLPQAVVPIDLFEPTDEWKEIGPNQQLPGGLWIRINLSTGKKEARNLPK